MSKRSCVFKRRPNAECRRVFCHKTIEALHFAPRSRLDLDGDNLSADDGQVINLAHGALVGILPIEQFRFDKAVMDFLQFETRKHLGGRTLVHEVNIRSLENVGGGQGEHRLHKSQVEEEILDVFAVFLGTEREAVGSGMLDWDYQPRESQHPEAELHRGRRHFLGSLSEDELLAGLPGDGAQHLPQQVWRDMAFVFGKVLHVGVEDVVVYAAAFQKGLARYPFADGLRHSANQKECAQLLLQLVMDRLRKGCALPDVLLLEGEETVESLSREKLVEREGEQVERPDSPHSEGGQLLKGELQQRTRRYDVKLRIVLAEIAQGFDGVRTFLYLVEEEQRLAGNNGDAEGDADNLADAPDIHVVGETGMEIPLGLQVDLHVIFEQSTQLADSRGFAHLTRSANQQRFVVGGRAPLRQLAVYVSFVVCHDEERLISSAKIRKILSMTKKKKHFNKIQSKNQSIFDKIQSKHRSNVDKIKSKNILKVNKIQSKEMK